MITWNASVITLYPEMFPGVLGFSLAGKGLASNLWSLKTYNIKDHGLGKHKKVDDNTFGGGAGLLLRADVVDSSINSAFDNGASRNLVYLTPTGVPLKQSMVKEIASADGVTILCGHFEGIDNRVIEKYNPTCISIGDYILSGGEIGAIVLLDSCIRLIDGVMNTLKSAEEESFENGLLEYPQYTRPAVWEGVAVPEVLLSGNHKNIEAWRLSESEELTKKVRPDLWEAYVRN